jgi:hypothetical protein
MVDSRLISFDDLDIEALTEAAKEAFEEVTWSLEKTLTQATTFGRILSSVRKKIPHGEWCGWVQETFGDTMSLRKIQRYMQIANASDQTLLEGAKTIDEALERIAEPKPRKASVEVVEPIEAEDTIEVVATSVEQPQTPKPAGNPKSDAAPRSSLASEPEFDLGSSLDDDRSAILDAAADYIAAKKLKHFIVMLRKVATDLEATIG